MPTASGRRYGAWLVSLVLHGALLAVVVFGGERLLTRTLAPGAPVLFPGAGGGGANRLAYIILPLAPPRPVVPPVPIPVTPPPVEREVPVTVPE
ncbi:MAG: hypothetical protein ACREMG_06060, partial [Gemmatimonadales bacterium]